MFVHCVDLFLLDEGQGLGICVFVCVCILSSLQFTLRNKALLLIQKVLYSGKAYMNMKETVHIRIVH